MIGTIVNASAIITGTIIGMLINKKIPEKLISIFFQTLGLFTILLGIKMAITTEEYLIIIGSLVMGSIIGELLGLEKLVEKFSVWIKTKIQTSNYKFSEGLITAFLLYCMGSLTILGAIDEGINGNPHLLFIKSLMDGVSSVALASAMGLGVGFSAIPLLIYQGGITLFAHSMNNFFSETMIRELSALGGILLIGLGINILEIKKLRIINMLPALAIVVLLILFFK